MKVVLSGGGTGGHITPLLATAAALEHHKPGLELHYIGTRSPAELGMLKGQSIKKHWILAGKYRRYPGTSPWQKLIDIKTWAANLVDVGKVMVGLVQSLRLLRRLHPQVVFVKGGYVGLPVGLAASWLKIPLVIHESDAIAGLTNRILAKRATRVATGLPAHYYKQWRGLELVHTGIPVRPEVLSHKVDMKPSNLPTILVVGGSSGARVINDALIKNLVKLSAFCRVVHITGRRDYQLMQAAAEALPSFNKERYSQHEFMSAKQLGRAISQANIVISRTGMTAVAEIAQFAKPLITIPIAVSTHQQLNAEVLKNHQAALVVEEDKVYEEMVTVIEQLVDSKTTQKRIGENLQRLFPNDAADRLATLIIQYL